MTAFPHSTFENGIIHVWESRLYRTTSTLIDLGQAFLLVDPNWLPDEVGQIRDFVDSHLGNKELYVLFTHSDFDHILGYGAFPDARTIASREFLQQKNASQIITQICEFDSQYYIFRPYQVSYPHVDYVIDYDGQTLVLGQTTVYFYLAPGHTCDGLWAIIPSFPKEDTNLNKGIWIAGDYFSNIEIPLIDYSLAAYQKTVQKAFSLIASFPLVEYMIPGHGDVAISQQTISDRIQTDRRYLTLLTALATNLEIDVTLNEVHEILHSYPFPREIEKIHIQNLNKYGQSEANLPDA